MSDIKQLQVHHFGGTGEAYDACRTDEGTKRAAA